MFSIYITHQKEVLSGDLISNHLNRDELIANAIINLRKTPKPEPRYGDKNPNGVVVNFFYMWY
jgi:hypothetical protein